MPDLRVIAKHCILSGLLTIAVGSLSCSSGDRNLHLLASKPLDAEAERLRKLQLLRVLDNSTTPPTPSDRSPADLVSGQCAEYEESGCNNSIADARNKLCLAKNYLAMASPQAGALQFGLYTLPPQSEDTNAAVADMAAKAAASALVTDSHIIGGLSDPDYGAGLCGTTDNDEQYHDVPIPGVAATLLMESFQVYKEARALSVNATEAVADARLGSSASKAQAVGGAMADTVLSRVAAAHMLVVGEHKLLGSTDKAFCTAAELSPDAKAALSIFRESALSPQDVLSTDVTTDSLVNGPETGTDAPKFGSVRARLAELYDYPALTAGQPVETYYHLPLTAFDEARVAMREEIVAFARSHTAALPAKRLPGGGLTTLIRFAGTASPPSPLPATYYAAIARQVPNSDPESDTNDEWTDPLPPPYSYREPSRANDAVVDWAFSYASMLANSPYVRPLTREQALGPVAFLLASSERQGRLTLFDTQAGTVIAAVDGFSVDDGLRALVGEDQLRCAVNGNIEGSACSDIGNELSTTATPASSFNAACSVGLGVVASANVYIVRPKVPGAPAAPGGYAPLVGVHYNGVTETKRIVPIVPEIEKRVGALLEPSRANCSHPKVSCAGVDFDERLPLEDELASTEDGVESSWKHYLALAKDAATQADTLGADYINTGLQQAQTKQATELQKEQQLQRADDEIQNLQSICGTDVDPRILLGWLDSGANATIKNLTEPCLSNSYCATVAPGTVCFSGECIVDFKSVLAQHANDPNLKRLADCVSDAGSADLISLGDAPVCLWRNSSNHNLVCEGASAGQCPQIAVGAAKDVTGSYTTACTTLLAPPPGNSVAASEPLGFFTVENDAGASTGSCDAFRKLRKDGTQWDKLSSALRTRNTFHPVYVADAARRLGFEFRFGGFSAITFDGSPKYETGKPFGSGPGNGGWPCQSSQPANCADEQGLFCALTDCSDNSSRAQINYRMMRAVLAAEVMNDSSSVEGGALPAFHDCPFHLRPTETTPAGFFGSTLNGETRHFWGDNFPVGWFSHGPNGAYSAVGSTAEHPLWIDETGMAILVNGGGLYGGLTSDCTPKLMSRSKLVPRLPFNYESLGGLSSVTEPVGWFRKVLSGELYDSFDAQYSLEVFGRNDATFVEPIPFAHSLTSDDFLNGLELICEVSRQDEVSVANPPSVASIDDLHRVAEYIQVLAQAIRNESGTRVFQNIPAAALEALKYGSANGSYPKYSGTLGAQISALRGGLIRLKDTIPLLANAVAQFAQGLDTLHDLLQKAAIKKKIDHLQLLSTISQQVANCGSTLGVQTLTSGSTAATCANSIAQIGIASEISKLSGQDTELDADLAKVNFQATFNTAATNMQTLSLRYREASEDVDSALATIDGLRNQANIALSRALYLASHEAQSTAAVTNVVGNLFDGKQLRYQRSLKNARLLAFLAKRSIEERLGVKLADLTDDLPLVSAPHDWESTVCTTAGVDYKNLLTQYSPAASMSGSSSQAATNYADGFIGDYVTKLENVVESYRLVNSFHEGTDTAVISLRDDIMNVRATCERPGPNLLRYSSNLAFYGDPGWQQDGCKAPATGEDVVRNCASASDAGAKLQGAGLSNAESASSQQFTVDFGSGALASAALFQTVALAAGSYRFSWYTPDSTATSPGVAAAFVSVASNSTPRADSANGASGAWNRWYIIFDVPTAQTIRVGFTRPTATTASVSVAGPMLELLPRATDEFALRPFVATGGELTRAVPECEDTSGNVFRASRWHRDCTLLCADGYSGHCDGGNAQKYCYQEASFDFNQRDLQAGKIANFSGFARGNFNYRIESVGVNFVGTGTRDCSDSSSPSTCGSAGFFPYSLSHIGPFYVRNYAGQDYQAHLFDGNIEHARGLASERYLTNPLSSADTSLIDQYMRSEFQGRPLDGNFILRVWEEPGVNFDAMQDVQLVIKYRYWTRFN